jgi:hypothetical protein
MQPPAVGPEARFSLAWGSWFPTLSAIRLRKGWGKRHSQRSYGAHGYGGRAFPGLRCAPYGAIILLSLREERQRVEVHRLTHLKIGVSVTAEF